MLRKLIFGRRIFRETFETPAGRMALAHIRHFCGGEVRQSPFDADPIGMARNVGRLEVYKEISRFLALTDDQIDTAAREARARGEMGPDSF